ncbi:MAG: pyrroline-5-carboxylate reductase [Caldilineaceae bacterium]|nr:pyrroline-5-carboxylate reductase [Caldilineaceae bacterium]
MLADSRITFIGSGAMGEAMIKGVLAQKLTGPKQITASDPIAARREALESAYGICTAADNAQAVRGASIIVLSVKPQIFEKVTPVLRGQIAPEALVLSIMAGVSLQTIQRGLQHERVVRSMPNTPAQVNMGVTAWIPAAAVTEEQHRQTATLLGALGEQIRVDKEDFIDMQTGLGGSGPGFVFLIIEAMIDAGVQMGFSRGDAQTIALQTVLGSAELMRQTGEHPAELRNKVTSPGGTTAAGIYELEKGGVRTVITNAVLAAYRRSQELGAISQKG